MCRPPELGGLGITDLQHFGDALCMRWLWLRRTEDNHPWQLLHDEQDPMVVALFQASTYFELGNGHKALFWEDRRMQGKSMSEVAPCLYAAISPRVKKVRTIDQALHENSWISDISGALTV